MENIQPLKRDVSALVWGTLFVWWGVSELPGFLPHGAGALGFGLILLGLNGLRLLKGERANSLSLTLGILAFLLGSLLLVRSAVPLPVELPIFAILLIALGLILLVRETLHSSNE